MAYRKFLQKMMKNKTRWYFRLLLNGFRGKLPLKLLRKRHYSQPLKLY